MTMQRHNGFTLIEMLAVLGIVSMLVGAILALSLQAVRLYNRTSPRIEPQQSQMLALRRMEQEIREAMVIDMDSMKRVLEIVKPYKDANELNSLENETLRPGAHVCFFLGQKAPSTLSSSWVAVPSETGDTIFRIENTDTNLPLGASYPSSDVRVIISGILAIPRIPDPMNPGQEMNGQLFTYAPLGPQETLTPDTGRVRITLTIPTKGGVNSTLSTEFCIRNRE